MNNFIVLSGPNYGKYNSTKIYKNKDILSANLYIESIGNNPIVDCNNILIRYLPDAPIEYQVEFYIRLYDSNSPFYLQKTFYINKNNININNDKLVLNFNNVSFRYNNEYILSNIKYSLTLTPNIVKKIYKNLFEI